MKKLLFLFFILSTSVVWAGNENLAFKAVITANGSHSPSYNPKYLADNKIPLPGSSDDVRQAWCLPQNISEDAWVSFEWEKPVDVTSIVYWGRTAFLDNENFSLCKVYIDDASDAIVSASLAKGAQGQVIVLPQRVNAKSIRLVFPSNYGGPNPGASEIGIFSSTPSQKDLDSYLNNHESINPEILNRIGTGEFGFTKLVVVQRHPVNSTHVYTYHQEGLRPGEVQSCIGCHADRNYAMAKTTDKSMHRPVAMMRKTQELEKPEWGVHGFSYPHIVQPVLDKHCVKCHGNDDPPAGLELTADKTDFFNVSYENLARKGTSVEDRMMEGGTGGKFKYSKYTSWISTHNGQEENILEIAPGRWGAKASLLATVVDSGHPDKDGKCRVDMSGSEKARIYAWLDLNCPYYGTSDSNYMELRGCRRQLPENFTGMMSEIASRRCGACHEDASKDPEWVLTLKDNL